MIDKETTCNRLKYTDRAIYVDNNIGKEDADVGKIFDYIVDICYMLAKKGRLFKDKDERESFALYMASIVYMRMTNPKTLLPETDPKHLPPIKSCLNYIKKTINAKRVDFLKITRKQASRRDDDVEQSAMQAYTEEGIKNQMPATLPTEVCLCFDTLDKIVKSIINSGVYKNDKVLCYKIYISVLLTLLNNYTVSAKNKERLRKAYTRSYYEIVLAETIKSEEERGPIVLGLDDSFKAYITFVAQTTKMKLVHDIKDILVDYQIPDDMTADILAVDAGEVGQWED